MSAADQHAPCPFCGNDGTGYFSVAGWPRLGSPNWKVVICANCQAQGPPVERLAGDSDEDFGRRVWLYWDQRGGQS